MLDKLKTITDRYEALTSQLEDPATYADPDLLRRLTREQKELESVAEAYTAYRAAEARQSSAQELLGDPELRDMAREEMEEARQEMEALREQMKDSGLGTPATRAAIIERLLTVGYIVRKGKTLLPTEKGRKLIEIVPDEMCSPQTTGKWEKGLSSIAKGKMSEERFMESIRRYVRFLVQDAASGRKAGVVFP